MPPLPVVPAFQPSDSPVTDKETFPLAFSSVTYAIARCDPPIVFEGGSRDDAMKWLDDIFGDCRGQAIIPAIEVEVTAAGKHPTEHVVWFEPSEVHEGEVGDMDWVDFTKAIENLRWDSADISQSAGDLWSSVKQAIEHAFEVVKEKTSSFGATAQQAFAEHSAALGLIVGGVAIIAAIGLLTFLLGAVGFGAIGVIAGSLAAVIQSVFYGAFVASGSIFAICQSIAMGGMAVLFFNIRLTAILAIIAGVAILIHSHFASPEDVGSTAY